MSQSENGPQAAVGLERRRRGIDKLMRFQLEAYKARIMELKRTLARERAEKRALLRDLESLRAQQRELAELLRKVEGRPDASAKVG